MAKGNKKKSKSPPATAPKDTQNISIREASSFQGPLPPPRILHDYDQIVQGSAERIIFLWENQVQHRQELEKKAIDSDIKQSHCGAILGFIIAMFAIGSGTFLAYIGRPTEGITAIVSALVGLIGVYGWGSYQRRKERALRINQ